MALPPTTRPIGVFDSGVGGLSVLKALRERLPQESFIYLADSGYAPYGERDSAHVLQRAQTIASYLIHSRQAKTLVIACNTATAAAVGVLREKHTTTPIIGIEPAIKPAAAQSRTGGVGVLATRSTLQSAKFAALVAAQDLRTRFVLQPCDGLAVAIERADTPEIAQLAGHYVAALGPLGHAAAQLDTLVLGCTHYALVADVFAALVAGRCTVYEAGAPVARRLQDVLSAQNLLAPAQMGQGSVELWSTGQTEPLERTAAHWMHMPLAAQRLDLA